MTAPQIIELIACHNGRLPPDATLGEAAATMLREGISSIIVVEGEQAVGIVTESDMLHALRRQRSTRQTLGAAMTSPVHSVPATTGFREAYREAARLGIRHIVVTDGGGLPVGVASESDFRHHLGPDFYRLLNNVDTLMDRLFPRLPPDAGLDAALAAMEAARASCVVVVEDRRPIGILTERDVVRLFLDAGDNPPLSAVMTHPVLTIAEDRSLADAAECMSDNRIRHLVVVNADGVAVGLLSEHTLMRPLEIDLVDDMLAERLSLVRSRDRALARTLRNERYQRALLDNFPFLVWLKDTDSRFLAVNRALAEAMGESAVDALIGRSDHDFSPPELAERYRGDDLAVMAGRQNKVVVEPVQVRGQAVWHETYKAPVVGDDGTLLGTVGFAQDISDRKRSEEAMLLRNAALAGLVRGEALVGVLDLIALSVEAEMPGWSCAILLTDADGKRLHRGAAPRLPEAFAAAIDGLVIAADSSACGAAAALGRRIVIDDLARHPDWQAYRDFAACCAEPIVGPEGQLLGTFTAYHATPSTPRAGDLARLGQASQLTALVLAHQQGATKLESSVATFRGIFDSINEALFVQAADGRFLDANTGAERMFGRSLPALTGQTLSLLGAAGLNNPTAIDRSTAAAFAGTPQTFEFWVQNAAGRVFPSEVRLHPASYFGQPVLIASVLEISERKSAELRLEIENGLARALAADMPREDALALVLQAALRFPELDAGAIYWQRPDGGYRLVAQVGLSPEFAASIVDYGPDTAQARLVRDGKIACSCSATCGKYRDSGLNGDPAMLREGLRCLVVLPLLVGGRPVASLHLSGQRTTQISAATLRELETLTRHVSQTLLRLSAQEEARRLQQNQSRLFDTLADFVFVVDQSGRIVHYNRAVADGLGYGPEALKGQLIAAVHPDSQRKTVTRTFAEMLAGQSTNCEIPLLRADGRPVPAETRVALGHWDDQPALFCVAQDISGRLIAEERQKLAASVFDNAHEGIMVTDPQGRIVEVNGTFSELTGYSRDEALGRSADLLKSGHHNPAFYKEMWRTIHRNSYWRGEVWNRKKSGEIFVELLTISTVRDRTGAVSHFVGIFSDITQLKQHQQRLEHLAHFDALTQLPNRMLLADRMQLAMAQAERSGKVLAVCYLDLDGFKPVNDQYGHAIGDRLLIEVAQRFKACIRAGDTVARLGGDEFVLLFADLDNERECDRAITRVIATLNQPFPIAGHSISISSSIGVTLFPQDGADSDTLLRHADQAMYAAKQSGRNRYHLFDPENDRRARVRHAEIARIREGLAAGEFVLYYQPKVDMRQGTVIGVEALIRWQHPERGLLLPGQFLPVIEGSELAVELGDWVIREALGQLAQWAEQGLRMSVSVNIAGNHLQHPGFVARLGELLAACPAVSPGLLELEVLETAALEDMTRIAELFAQCRRLGVSFALDDFGTGYSSLTYFRRLPADVLKIDQSFVRDMLDDPEDLAIVEGVIGLTQAFRRQVIAEGVETVEHGLVLLLLGCDHAQGFGIARPMPAGELPGWVGGFRPDDLWSSATAFRWSRDDLPMLIAEVDHNRWKKALYAYLDAPAAHLPEPLSDHRDCRFGRWYGSADSRRYAAVDGFAELEATHARIHDLGNELVRRRRAEPLAALAPLKEELEAASARLIGAIQQIQAELLIAAHAIRR